MPDGEYAVGRTTVRSDSLSLQSKKTNRAMTTNLRQLFLEHVGQTSDNPMMLEVERAEGVYLYGRTDGGGSI